MSGVDRGASLSPQNRLELTPLPHIPTWQPAYEPNGSVCKSLYVPDQLINPHPRFATLTANIRERRGAPVCIAVPLFMDKNTPKNDGGALTLEEAKFPGSAAEEAKDDDKKPSERLTHPGVDSSKMIHMDAMAFGMGCCCLQVTFQTRSVEEARHLYDHLAVLSPIVMALTASTPFMRGRVADTDVRWSTISQSVDDRPPAERPEGKLPCGNTPRREPVPEAEQNRRKLFKSRYDSISSYISLGDRLKPEYNDIDLPIDEKSYATLVENGIDDRLAKHIAHLFTRDPLVIFDESIEQVDDQTASLHFENIQSTNWQTVRFKPPPPESSIGWRVEFRTMEVQLTDFENAAFTCFIALVSRAILLFGLNLYVPISKVDENMRRAHQRDAYRKEKFWFRRKIDDSDEEETEMTMQEIFCGKGAFPGLLPLVRTYLDVIKVS